MLSKSEVNFERRGFCGATTVMRQRLETVGGAFVEGYNLGLSCHTTLELSQELNKLELETRGFAFEGAGMALGLLDSFMPWSRSRVDALLHEGGWQHRYMIHVGLGWAWARVPFGFRRHMKRLDPLLGWLAIDGWGFHEGFFHWNRYATGNQNPRLNDDEKNAFDQGLGRSLWFVKGGNIDLIAGSTSLFPKCRQANFWSGIGLAATYAGIKDVDSLLRLRKLAGDFAPCLAQGSAFACKARMVADNVTFNTEKASSVFCGIPADAAARITDGALENLPIHDGKPAYAIWRERIQKYFASSATITPKTK